MRLDTSSRPGCGWLSSTSLGGYLIERFFARFSKLVELSRVPPL